MGPTHGTRNHASNFALQRDSGVTVQSEKWSQCNGDDAGYSSFSKGDLDTAAMEAGAPEGFFCPISLKLFRDPVMLPTGQTCAPLTPSGQPGLPMPDRADRSS